MKKLINNQKLKNIILSGDQEYIAFVFDDRALIYKAEGDWCSYTWVQDVLDKKNVLGKKIVKVEDLYMGGYGKIGEDEYIRYHALELTSQDGLKCKIEFRNSSNGYYDGSLEYDSKYSLDLLPGWVNEGA